MNLACVRRSTTAIGLGIALTCVGFGVRAAGEPPPSLVERARGAQRVVVASAAAIETRMDTNKHGDQLIVSRVLLQIEETLKGAPIEGAWMELEGGTVDGLTLRVSDLPELQTGERGVFFLAPQSGGSHLPHLRGRGILKLESNNVVRGSSLHLDEIRRVVRGAR